MPLNLIRLAVFFFGYGTIVLIRPGRWHGIAGGWAAAWACVFLMSFFLEPSRDDSTHAEPEGVAFGAVYNPMPQGGSPR